MNLSRALLEAPLCRTFIDFTKLSLILHELCLNSRSSTKLLDVWCKINQNCQCSSKLQNVSSEIYSTNTHFLHLRRDFIPKLEGLTISQKIGISHDIPCDVPRCPSISSHPHLHPTPIGYRMGFRTGYRAIYLFSETLSTAGFILVKTYSTMTRPSFLEI